MCNPVQVNEDELTAVSSTAFLLAMTLCCVFSHEALEVVVRLTATSGTALIVFVVPYLALQFFKRHCQR